MQVTIDPFVNITSSFFAFFKGKSNDLSSNWEVNKCVELPSTRALTTLGLALKPLMITKIIRVGVHFHPLAI